MMRWLMLLVAAAPMILDDNEPTPENNPTPNEATTLGTFSLDVHIQGYVIREILTENTH